MSRILVGKKKQREKIIGEREKENVEGERKNVAPCHHGARWQCCSVETGEERKKLSEEERR